MGAPIKTQSGLATHSAGRIALLLLQESPLILSFPSQEPSWVFLGALGAAPSEDCEAHKELGAGHRATATGEEHRREALRKRAKRIIKVRGIAKRRYRKERDAKASSQGLLAGLEQEGRAVSRRSGEREHHSEHNAC